MSPAAGSPYEQALGSRKAQLHPALQRYFATIPPGSVGIGEGVFEQFGTTHRWLWPFLTVLKRHHVIVPGMHHRVSFRIENRTIAGRQTAARTLELASGTWTMIDAVSLMSPGHVRDALGRPALVEADFEVGTEGTELCLSSRSVAVRLGPVRVPVPKVICPIISLHERFDEEAECQRVRLTVDLPGLGRIYQYNGMFTYRIEEAQ